MIPLGLLVFLPLFSVATTSSDSPNAIKACAKLASVSTVPHVSIVKTTHYQTGELSITRPIGSPVVNDLPFCRLVGFYNQTGASNKIGHIGFELWLPDREAWNHRYLGVGGDGFVGSVDVSSFGTPLNQGFALAGTDSGHQFNRSFSSDLGVYIPYLHSHLGLTDWIHDSNHYTAVASKALIDIYYGRKPVHSYFTGCSTGGGQALALAQLWPEDFDGIHAGCPGSFYSGLMMAMTWAARALKAGNNGGDPSKFPQSALNLIYASVLEACDELDGLKDGLISAPLNCSFDPATLACPPGEDNSDSCLTASQLATARAFYSGPVDPVMHKQIYPGTFEVHDKLGVFVDANSPDLRRFHTSGGKLIVSQSLADNINPQKYPLDYYTRVKATVGKNVDPWFRLFHVPGAFHCGLGGPGPNYFDPVPQLMKWAEDSTPPERIVAKKFNNGGGLNRSMPLCPWPNIAMYVSGDVDVEGSFACQ
ncbi:tannase and feruloyl esterase [Mycena crocata]|nr:tannase and feruloyl esterase [Mycena crocata]